MILLKNGLLIDGSGGTPYPGDLWIDGARIAVSGPSEIQTIDCTGLAIAPGFIDLHSHGDLQVLEGKLEKLKQGVVMEVVGNCGFSPFPYSGDPNELHSFGGGILGHPDGWGWRTANAYLDSVAQEARANFILARVAIASGHPDVAVDDFQKTIATSKDPRLLAWSHIYLGRILDLDCKRDQAVSEYHAALAVRDGQQDTRIAAERGTKTAYAVKGHSCDEDADDSAAPPASKPGPAPSANPAKPQ